MQKGPKLSRAELKQKRAEINAIMTPVLQGADKYYKPYLSFSKSLSKASEPGHFNVWQLGKLSKESFEGAKAYIDATQAFIHHLPVAFFEDELAWQLFSEQLEDVKSVPNDLLRRWQDLTKALGDCPESIEFAAKQQTLADQQRCLQITRQSKMFSPSLLEGRKKIDTLLQSVNSLEKTIACKKIR